MNYSENLDRQTNKLYYNYWMIKLPPTLKLLSTLVISFLLSFAVINFIVSQINSREKKLQREATQVVQQEISNKFELTLDVSLVVGKMSSAYIHQKVGDNHYGELVHQILEDKNFILGLNQLDPQGKIINIYPEDENQGAMGKVTQNFQELMRSYDRGEKFWFSPPLELFQGTQGFVFYIPIKIDNKLSGWIAPVISSELFFKHFRERDFFNKYELVIKDRSTGNIYFETGLPSKKENFKEVSTTMWGRDIIFISWPKISNPPFEIPFFLRFIISLLISFFCTLSMKIHLQKRKAYNRLEDISDVLKLTSNDILSKLIDIQNTYLSNDSPGFTNSEAAEKEIQSAMNLFEQVELLQNIAGSEHFDEETFEILPLVREHLYQLKEIVSKKNLSLKLDVESFKEIKITGNRWLISNSVLKNALSFSALISCPDGRIEVSHSVSQRECSTIFYIEKIIEEEMSKAFRIDRRLLVAQNVMNLLNGEITIREDGSGGMILKLSTERAT